jgi:hypothetical protein
MAAVCTVVGRSPSVCVQVHGRQCPWWSDRVLWRGLDPRVHYRSPRDQGFSNLRRHAMRGKCCGQNPQIRRAEGGRCLGGGKETNWDITWCWSFSFRGWGWKTLGGSPWAHLAPLRCRASCYGELRHRGTNELGLKVLFAHGRASVSYVIMNT